MSEKFSEKLKKYDNSIQNTNNSFAVLGQYVPIHKFEKNKEEHQNQKATSPFEQKNESSRLNIYDGDYLQYQYSDRLNLYSNNKLNIWQYLKYLFFNLPLINILYLKIKQSKIRQTINTIDKMSLDINNYSNYLRNSASVSTPKFKNSNTKYVG